MPSWFRAVRKTLSWHRRAVAAVCAVVAVLALAAALRPPDAPGAPVVVAAATLRGGQPVAPGDVRVARWPAELVPAEAITDPSAVIGRTLAAPVTSGTPLTAVAVVADRSGALAPGMVIAPVRVADPDLIALLRPGDRIDLLGAGAEGRYAVLADGVRLVAVPTAEESGGGLAPSGSGASMVLVEVDADAALTLAEAAAAGPIAVVLR